MSILKKGGKSRYVMLPLAQNDSFVLPIGFRIDGVFAEQIAAVTTAPTVAIGTVAAVQQTGTITIAGTSSAASTVFSIDGIAASAQIPISQTAANTVAQIYADFGPGGAKAAALKNAGWVLTGYNGLVISFIGSPSKTSSAPTIVATSLATQTVTSAVVVTGVPSVDAMAATSMGATTAALVTNFSSAVVTAGKWYVGASAAADVTYYVSADLVGVGNLNVYVEIEKLN